MPGTPKFAACISFNVRQKFRDDWISEWKELTIPFHTPHTLPEKVYNNYKIRRFWNWWYFLIMTTLTGNYVLHEIMQCAHTHLTFTHTMCDLCMYAANEIDASGHKLRQPQKLSLFWTRARFCLCVASSPSINNTYDIHTSHHTKYNTNSQFLFFLFFFISILFCSRHIFWSSMWFSDLTDKYNLLFFCCLSITVDDGLRTIAPFECGWYEYEMCGLAGHVVCSTVWMPVNY